jgi:hypothetical protein
MLNGEAQVGSNVKYPQLISVAKVCGNLQQPLQFLELQMLASSRLLRSTGFRRTSSMVMLLLLQQEQLC